MRHSVYDLRLETGVQKHKILRIFKMNEVFGYTSFVKYENEQIYKIEEGQHSIGAPFFYYEKIDESKYKILRKKYKETERIFNKTKKDNSDIFDEFDLIFSHGKLIIQKNEDGKIHMIEKSSITATNPFHLDKEINGDYYKIYKNPTKKEFKALLSKSFLNPTLFYYFFNKNENLEIIDEIINDYKKISIKDTYIKKWFEKRREFLKKEKIMTNSFTVLEKHNLQTENKTIEIREYSKNEKYLISYKHDENDFDYQKIASEDYENYKKSTKESLKVLLTKGFFDISLFLIFITKKENLLIANEIVLERKFSKFKDYKVKEWFEKRLNNKKFKKARFLQKYKFNTKPIELKFINSNILEFHLNDKLKNKHQTINIDISKNKKTETEIFLKNDSSSSHLSAKSKFNSYAKTFGEHNQYKVKCLFPKEAKLIINSKEFEFSFIFPKNTKYHYLYTFNDEESSKQFKNSFIFMYSQKSKDAIEEHFLLRFEVLNNEIIYKTKSTIENFDDININPNGIISFVSEKNDRFYVEFWQI